MPDAFAGNHLAVAELKQLIAKSEVVEWTDISAAAPRLLFPLRCYRNTIPIPAHWSTKCDYLRGKRGIEKPPFQLPSYIADTPSSNADVPLLKEKYTGHILVSGYKFRLCCPVKRRLYPSYSGLWKCAGRCCAPSFIFIFIEYAYCP